MPGRRMLVNRPIETDKILFCSDEKRWKCSRIVSRNSQSFALMNANTTRILLSWNNNLHRFSVTFHPCFVSRGSLSLFAVEHKKCHGEFELGAVSQAGMRNADIAVHNWTAIFITTARQFFHQAHHSLLMSTLNTQTRKLLMMKPKIFACF